MSLKQLLRLIMAVITVGLLLAAANYYLGLGWFGDRARLVYSTAVFIGAVYLGVAIRLWRGK